MSLDQPVKLYHKMVANRKATRAMNTKEIPVKSIMQKECCGDNLCGLQPHEICKNCKAWKKELANIKFDKWTKELKHTSNKTDKTPSTVAKALKITNCYKCNSIADCEVIQANSTNAMHSIPEYCPLPDYPEDTL